MAVNINVNHGTLKRGDLYMIDPLDFIINPELRGREFPPDPKIMAEWIKLEGGIQAPVTFFIRTEDRKPEIVAGASRVEGAIYANTNKMLAERVLVPARLVKPEDAKARFLSTISENQQRHSTSWVDDAFNIQKLIDLGVPDKEICVRYGANGKAKSSAWLGEMRSVLTKVPKTVMKELHEKHISASSAFVLADVVPGTQGKVLELAQQIATDKAAKKALAVVNGNGSNGHHEEIPVESSEFYTEPAAPSMVNAVFTEQETPEALKPIHLVPVEPAPPTKPTSPGFIEVVEAAQQLGVLTKKIGLKMTQLKSLLEKHTGPGERKHVKEFCGALLQLLGGDISIDDIEVNFERNFK